jgi:hypothetical protein
LLSDDRRSCAFRFCEVGIRWIEVLGQIRARLGRIARFFSLGGFGFVFHPSALVGGGGLAFFSDYWVSRDWRLRSFWVPPLDQVPDP